MPKQAYKQCSTCAQRKPLEAFGRFKLSPDGLRYDCKECNNAKSRRWNRENAERKRRNDKRLEASKPGYRTRLGRQWRAANPERVAAIQRRQYDRHPEKFRARQAVKDAVKAGSLNKPDCCEDCGGEASGKGLHGHHTDYSRPLDVRWLCSRCHSATHQRRSCSPLVATDPTSFLPAFASANGWSLSPVVS